MFDYFIKENTLISNIEINSIIVCTRITNDILFTLY